MHFSFPCSHWLKNVKDGAASKHSLFCFHRSKARQKAKSVLEKNRQVSVIYLKDEVSEPEYNYTLKFEAKSVEF